MHRSGTSALAGALGIFGARLPMQSALPVLKRLRQAIKTLRRRERENPKGYFEPEEIVRIHDRLLLAAGTSWSGYERVSHEWLRSAEARGFVDELVGAVRRDYADAALFVVKDPRMCRIMPLWRIVLDRIAVKPGFAIPIRRPLEVARSLERRDPNKFTPEHGCQMWLRHVLDAERETRGSPRVFVHYHELLKNPAQIAEHVIVQLAGEKPAFNKESAEHLDSFIDPQLQHHAAESEQLQPRMACHPWLLDAYDALSALVLRPNDEAAQRRLDGVSSLFDASMPAVFDAGRVPRSR